jgi:hypothetical protein
MRFLIGSLLGLFLIFGGTATADPIAVTSGFVAFTDEPGAFRVAGSGFDVAFGFFPQVVSGTFWHDRCASGCAAGTAVDFGTTTYTFSESFQGIGGTVNGIDYPQLFSAGEVTFTGPTIVLPSAFPEPGVPVPSCSANSRFGERLVIHDRVAHRTAGIREPVDGPWESPRVRCSHLLRSLPGR